MEIYQFSTINATNIYLSWNQFGLDEKTIKNFPLNAFRLCFSQWSQRYYFYLYLYFHLHEVTIRSCILSWHLCRSTWSALWMQINVFILDGSYVTVTICYCLLMLFFDLCHSCIEPSGSISEDLLLNHIRDGRFCGCSRIGGKVWRAPPS